MFRQLTRPRPGVAGRAIVAALVGGLAVQSAMAAPAAPVPLQPVVAAPAPSGTGKAARVAIGVGVGVLIGVVILGAIIASAD